MTGLEPHSLLVKPARKGDANLDGKVDFADLLILAQHYGPNDSAGWDRGDFNYDGQVTFADLLALAQAYGAGSATAAGNADGAGMHSGVRLRA